MNNRLRFIKHLFVGLFFFTTIGLSAQSTFTVTNTNDSGAGSLRQAITDANANGDGLDVINFSSSVSGTILLSSSLPTITSALTINGTGEEVLSVSGQNAHRILYINSTGDVTINDLTLKEGRAQGGNAGSGASGGGGGAGMGGAIFLEQGNLTLNFTSLVSNTARGGKGGTFNNPQTAFGGAGGAGPLGAGGAATTEDGVNGVFGSGGSGGGLRFSGEARTNGGNGGYGAGAGSVGSSGGGASGVGTTGVPGTFGGTTSNPANGVVQSGGGGAGLGAALFIYGGSVSLNTVTVLNNSTQAGGAGGSGASSGQAKASGIFHYSGSLTNNGIIVSGNSAPNAGTSASDNADFYSQTGLSLSESNPPVIGKSFPTNGETNYQKTDGLVIYMNENIFKTDGSAIADVDLSGIITFKETNASGADIAFTASIVRNKITITPDSELTNGQAYYIAIANLEDRYGNEMVSSETIAFTVDGTAPLFTADPESGTTILGRSFAFTADEAFFDLDGTEIEPSEYINVVKVRLDDATGDLVSTTITRDGNTLQVSLDEALPDQLYHVTLENIADANGNEITPQIFNYSRPAFAEAKIRVIPRDGSILSTQAIEVTFEEDYYVETAPGTFALFNTRSYSQAYTDAVLDLKLNDENGADIIDKWSFNNGGDVLYILSNMERNSTYYLKIANLFTADQTPVEAVEITFNTSDQFNPVAGGGYSLTNFRTTINGTALGSQASMEFIVQLNGGSRRQGLFQGWASDFSDRVLFWLNDNQLVLSILDGSGNVISNQSISSNTFDESALATSFQHVGFTHDNGTVVFYYNGLPVGSGTLDISNYSFSETGTSYSSLTGDFGSVSLDPSGFMSVDEVRIWSTALSAQVVSDWHQVRMSDTHPNFDQCRNLWLFDESGGKLAWDSKNNEANYSFNSEPVRTVSTRFAVPQVQVSADDIVLASGDEVTFTAGNGGQLQKEFTITNTGTVDLDLLGEASVSDFEGRFEIDYSETDLLLAPGASTSFTVTFQSSDVRVYNTFLTIPNSSLVSAFEVNLVGRGVSISNGNWERIGGKNGLPAIQELWANNGDIYFVTSVSGNSVSKLIKATISPDGNLDYEVETTLPSLYHSSNYDLIGDNSGNFYTITDPGNGTGIQVKNIITNQSESFLIETSNDKMDGLLKVDLNGTVRFVHSFSDGSAYNQYGIKIQTGIPSTETITLTMEDLRTIFGTDIGTSVFAYSIAFDSNNQLFATVGTSASKVLVLKYDATTGWEDIGYDYNTIGVSRNATYVNLIIDQNDNIHVGGIEERQLRYHKFSPTGTLLEGGFTTDQLAGSNFTSFPSRQGGNLFGLGAANEPIFLFDRGSGSNGHSAAVFEDGTFRLFNETYISGTESQSTSNAKLSIDGVTGRPFVSTDGSNGPSDLWTTQSIDPELTASIDDKQIEAGNSIPIQVGVGFEYEFDLVISNSGLTNLQLTGDPLIAFTGDNTGDLSFDISGVTSTLTIGAQVSIPITFAPRTVYTNQEVVVSIPNTTPAGNLEFTLVLNALDDTNTGEWTVHTDIVDPPYTDVDMRIGKNNQPVYTYNTYQTIVYPSGPNAGVTIPYARLETYQEVSGLETFDPDVLDENINLSTTYPLTDYFPQIQSLVNPSNNLNHFAFGTIQSNSIRPNLFVSHPVSGLSRVTYANNRIGRADFEFDENGDPWFLLMDDENGFLFLAKDGEENIFFSGLSRNSKDLDLEIGDGFMYSMTQENGQSLGYKSPIGSRSTSQGAVTFLGSSSNQLRNGNYSDETHNKDIELFDGKQYTAWIRSDGGIEFYENTAFVSNPGVSNVIDLQLQIHPDGTPYIAYIEDLGANQFPVSVIKLVAGVWETVGEPRFSYGDYDDQHAGLTGAPTRPALRAAFQINDLGQLFVFYGDIYTVTEAPEAFNRPPAFTSVPVTEIDEEAEYVYNITTSDIDLDALTISTVDLPAWLTFTDNGDGTATLSGTPTDEDAIAYSFSVVVSDGSLTTSQEISLTVNDLNTVPYFDQPVATLTIDQDAELQTLDLTGLSDGDFHLEQALSFEVVSDNEFLLSSLSAIANEDGTGSLLYQPASGESGVATITLTLLDDGTPQESIAYDIEITVNPVTDPNAIVVTNTNDSGEGSLRAAIIAANENPDHNVIDLRFIEGTIALASTLPTLSSNMDIVGTDASPVTVSGENAHQVFFMESGLVTLRSFSIANGRNTGGAGNVGDGGGGGGAGFGGAIFLNDGNLIVDRMTFSGNTAQGGAGSNSSGVLGGQGGSSLFGDGGAGGAAVFGQPGGSGGNGPVFGTGGGGGGQGSSGFVGGRGGNGNFGGGAGGGGGSSSGDGGNTGAPGEFGGVGGVAKLGGGGGGGAGLGGAIFAKSGNLIISNSTFSSNNASGGTRGTNSGTIQTSQSTTGQGKGGAIFLYQEVAYKLVDVVYSGNNASSDLNTIGDDNNIYIGSESAAPSIFLSNASIDENQSGPALIGNLSTFTGNPSDVFYYSIISSSLDENDLEIDGEELNYIGTGVDFETLASFNVQIESTTGTVTNLSNFTIAVNDLNDPATDFDLVNRVIDEGQAVGTVVGTFSATDEDLTNTHIYSLVNGFGDNASFQSVGDELQVAEVFDYDDKTSYSIRVELDDSGVTLTRDFTITVNNINVAPSAITLSNSSIPENSYGDFLIGTLSAVDSDDEDTHTFGFTGVAGLETADFKLINGDLYTNRNFDFETESSLQVEIYARDNNAESVDQILTISITDANDVTTALNISSSQILEAQPAGTEIGILSAIDPDATDTHTFILVSGFSENYAVNIVGNSLQTAVELDFDVLPALDLKINVNDGNGGVNEFELTIEVINVNQAPTAIAISNDNIDEDAAVGSIIGTLSTADADVDDTHTYEILIPSGSIENTILPIMVEGANIVTTDPLDFETLRFFNIDIQVTDSDGLPFKQFFTLSVNDINEAPTSMTLSANTIAENTASGVRIGQLIAADPDANDPLTYSLVAGEGDEGNAFFQIGGAGNELENAAILDFETQSTYSVRARVTDAAGLFYEEAFTIHVVDGNDQPTAIAISSSEIDEDAPVGTVIGSLTTTDEDANDQHAYEVLAINDQTTSQFIMDGANLITTVPLDFETTPVYTVVIEATDEGGLTWPETFEIVVIDANDAPTAITLSNDNIDEDAVVGSIIGTMSTEDADVDDTHTYEVLTSIEYEGSTISPIVADGANLVTTVPLDFETLPLFNIDVQVTDAEGLTFTESFMLHTNNVNEAPTSMTLNANTTNENTAAGVRIGQLIAVDPDANDPLTYSLVAGEGDEGNASFQIGGVAENEIENAVVLDFETQSIYSVRVRATDAAGLFYEQAYTIEVMDINEAPTAMTLTANTISENAAAGTSIGSFDASDPDANDQLTYTLVAGEGDEGNASFQIGGVAENEIENAVVLDFETQSIYSVRVRATDAAGLFYEQAYTIEVSDSNDSPTGIELSSQVMVENAELGAVVGSFTVIDQDAEDSHTFTLSESYPDHQFFTIDGVELKVEANIDFEINPALTIGVIVNDADGGNSFTEEFEITVTDANDAPLGITLSNDNIDEDAEIGSVIGVLSTDDPDNGDEHTYEVLTPFIINGETFYPVIANGSDLVTTIPLDYETNPIFEIEVQSTDAGGLSFIETFTLTANDKNDPPSGLELSSTEISENVAIGTVIGTLNSIDQDAGDTHTYSLVSGFGDNTAFSINGNELKTEDEFDFETKDSYEIEVQSFDGNGGAFFREFTISVSDVNEAPIAIALSSNTINENAVIGTIVGIVSGSDPDTGDVLSYSLDPIALNGDMFEMVGNELRTAVPIDFESLNNPMVVIAAKDKGALVFERSFQITVSNINEAPVAIALSKSDIDEDAPEGSVIGTLSTDDQDVDDTHTYEVLTPFVVDGQSFFPIIAQGSELVTTVPMDYEQFPFFTIDVQTTDEGGLSYIETFTLTANDVNEKPTALILSNNAIDENKSIGTLIGNLSSTDEDVNDTHDYSLFDGFGDNQEFTISGSDLTSNAVFDFETKSNYTIKVRILDAGGNVFEQELNILVNDANDAPTAIALSSNSLDENKAAGTVIGSLTATDEDASATHSFTLLSGFGDNSDFSISNNQLISAAEFDFETKDSYSIKVKADDGAGGLFEQEFTIDILNVTEGVSQTITFDPLPSKTFGDEAFELTATASSGLEVVYTSSNEAIVSISGNTATILAVGEVTIIASQSGVEGTFEAANPVSQVLTVNKASQTITFDAIADQVAGADPITLVASSTSGLEVSFSVTGAASLNENTLTITGVGEVIVTASQLGSVNYEAATDVVRSFVVNDPVKTDQTITFNPPATVYVNDESIVLQATSDSGLEVAFEVVSGSEFISQSGNALIIVKAGTVSVRAYQGGDETFNPASVVKQIVIKPVFTVSGTVTDENGETFTEGEVVIINAGKTSGTGTALDAAGNYTFIGVKEGIYYVGVIPNDEAAYYITGYGDAIIFQNAIPINLNSDVSNIDIQMVARPDTSNELTGDGEVTGRVIEGDGTGNRIEMGSVLEGVAIEGASIFLIRKSDDKILTEVFTDVNGDFKISGIPEGSFSILINIPGVEGNVSSDITVKKGTKVQMTAMVGEDGIVFETEVSEVLGLDDLEWTMYPNPAQDFIKLEVDGLVTFRILSINGMSIEGESFENETSIDIKELKPGIYFLELIKDGKASVQKFIKVN